MNYIIQEMKNKFKYKWQAKVYSKWLWLKTILTTRDIIHHKYGLSIRYPDETWHVVQILITKGDSGPDGGFK